MGDFSKILDNPAKLSARMGQSFSKTTEAFHVPRDAVQVSYFI
jgi:hypothetical protein